MAISQRKLKYGTTVYEIRVFRGRDALTGKQLTPYSMRYTPPDGYSAKRALKEAQIIAAQFEADCRAGKVLTKAEQKAKAEEILCKAAAMPTFQTYAKEWLKDISTSHAIGTIRTYTTALERAGEVFNNYKIEDITPYMIRQYLSDLQREDNNRRTGGKLAWATYVRHYAILRCLFQSAEDNEIIDRSPMAKIKRPRRPKDDVHKDPDVFTKEEVAYILDCMKQEPLKWRALVTFALDSGCRRGEIAALMWNDIRPCFKNRWKLYHFNKILIAAIWTKAKKEESSLS